MAVSLVYERSQGGSTSPQTLLTDSTGLLQADDVLIMVVQIKASAAIVSSFSFEGTTQLLDSIAHDGVQRTELWKVTLTANDAAAANWTVNYSASPSNPTTWWGVLRGLGATPFKWSKASNTTSDTSIETASVTPDIENTLLMVVGCASGFTVAPTSVTLHADLTEIDERVIGTGAGSWRIIGTGTRSLSGTSATSAYSFTVDQTLSSSHGWQILAQPPLTEDGPMAPNVEISRINLTGVLSSIQDDPDSPDANWLTGPRAN